MTDQTERCGAVASNFRLACDRPKGHVKSRHPDDWHEAASTTTTRQQNSGWTHDITQHETCRWAPNLFELPEEDMRRELNLKKPAPEETP